eukprot:208911_1
MPDVKAYTNYIRQHALKYVPSAPHKSDEAYHLWYQKLKKVENILHKKYMNKLARTIHRYENITVNKQQSTLVDHSSESPPRNVQKQSDFFLPDTSPVINTPTMNFPNVSNTPSSSNHSNNEELQQIICNLRNIIQEQSIKIKTVSDKLEEQIGFISVLQKQNHALQIQNDEIKHINRQTMNGYNDLKMKYDELELKYEQQRKCLDAKCVVDTNWSVGVNDYFDGLKDFDQILDIAIDGDTHNKGFV